MKKHNLQTITSGMKFRFYQTFKTQMIFPIRNSFSACTIVFRVLLGNSRLYNVFRCFNITSFSAYTFFGHLLELTCLDSLNQY